jgi:hypothetical protein
VTLAQPAQANLVMSGGQGGQSNGLNSANATGSAGTNVNDLIFNLYGLSKVDGTYYGQVKGGAGGNVTGNYNGFVYLDTSSTLSFQYIGSEAGNKNEFESPGITSLFTSPGNGHGIVDYTASGVESSGAAIAAGNPANSATAIDFSFVQNGGHGGTGTASNGDPYGSFCTSCSLFVVFLDPTTLNPLDNQSLGSTVADVFFNDGNTDDNHDDMAIRITATPVPVPAALPIVGAALAGFGFAGFKSRRHAA